ncbi:polysaccharide biosynthesis protein [Oscillochloris sp. ZM17-4]|uniref:nucleoside-diphosphate sugar epimerase/dehydratase n=1 Tax=Oscillochloris sp. ZM17-4 TaxID=2866714 RepID=UPI001C731F11|nr:nucleoside-diphosphate sugar epimerase/dehydratase [Oscillochloris sp. ZM17-4]MBX0330469.1 polysaccharide biosynthesis protein [Oscillochloris sp. ZM17-4]
MREFTTNRRLFTADIVLLIGAAYISFVLRLESLDLAKYWLGFALFAAMATIITPALFYRAGIYAQYWRYASINELFRMALAITAVAITAETLLLAADWLLPEVDLIPQSVPAIFLLLALPMTATPRMLRRLEFPYKLRRRDASGAERVLVVGAGDAGESIARDLRQRHPQGRELIGFIDDDPAKNNIRIHGVPVLGDRYAIPRLVQAHEVRQVIIAVPSAAGKAIREIVSICEGAGVETKIIPGLSELLDGTVNISMLRDVQIDDLLRREPIHTDTTGVSDLIRGRRVLVTGGGGSIGSELCRQILHFEPAELLVLGHGENSVFTIQNELLQHVRKSGNSTCRIDARIADLRFLERIGTIFEEYRPEIVFHAAAHKHVPLMELNPVEAITNNILGTRNLLQASLAAGIAQFVMISTDKAVNPTSVMGSSKRVAELLVHHAAKLTGKPYVAVRFGNVLGSRGSVVLTFKQQIAAGGPVTVTHPEMRRFFMTIPEAVQLTLQASVLGHGGEVFTLDMGEPVKIVDLARDMIELSGLKVGRDIDIVFSGMRPGEKLYEELFLPDEEYRRTQHQKIFISHNASSLVPANLLDSIATLEDAAMRNDAECIRHVLARLAKYGQPAPQAEQEVQERAVGELRAVTVGR